MVKALALSVAFFVPLHVAHAEGLVQNPYDVHNYAPNLASEPDDSSTALDEGVVADALFLISGLDYQRFVVGDKTAVYIVLKDRHPDATYHPLCEHQVDKFEKVGIVKSKNSLDALSSTQMLALQEIAVKCRAGTFNPHFTVTAFERELDGESGADHRLEVRDTVTLVARTLIGTYSVLRGYGKIPAVETSRSLAETN